MKYRKIVRFLSSLQVLTLLLTIAPQFTPDTNAADTFSDVSAAVYYADPVAWAVENDITNGTAPNVFNPDSTCTRAQVVTFLWRAAGGPEPSSNRNPFMDVVEGQYYYKAVLWAVEKGITSGVSVDKFSPDSGCTRAQVVTFLWRTEGKSASKSTAIPFADVNLGEYYGLAVLWAVEKGVTNGTTPTTFSPNQTCTRAQIVTFLYRALMGNRAEEHSKVDLDEMVKFGPFTYTDESLSEKYNSEIAATVGDQQLTNALLQIFYWSTVYNDLNQNADYLSSRGPDVSRPLAEQNYSKAATWEQHYLQTALDYYLQNVALTNEATKNGVTVTAETQQMIDQLPANLAAQATENGFTTVEDYLTQSFGPCVSLEDYLEYYRLTSLAYTYAGQIQQGVTVSDEEVEAFFDRHAEEYAQQGIEKIDQRVLRDAEYEKYNTQINELFSKYELKVDYRNLYLFDIVSRSIAEDAATES